MGLGFRGLGLRGLGLRGLGLRGLGLRGLGFRVFLTVGRMLMGFTRLLFCFIRVLYHKASTGSLQGVYKVLWCLTGFDKVPFVTP